MRMTTTLRSYANLARQLSWFGRGYLHYLLTKRNDQLATWVMRQLFCATNGRLNDAMALLHRVTRPAYPTDTRDSFIRELNRERLARIVQALDRDGFYVFEDRIPDDLCQGLIDFAHRTKYAVVDQNEKQSSEPVRFDPAQPAGIRFDAALQDIMENREAQRVVSDRGLLAIAQAYFRGKAVQDLVAMWWSVAGTQPSSRAAQLYHFDMDRIKFLKFFCYLTDVGPDNGPHCYIAGSHRRLPGALRHDRRLSDEEVFQHYPPDKRVEITGPRGTLCAVDTRGLHKGKRLILGHRLMFQVEFAIDLFGMSYPSIVLNENFSPDFLATVKQYPYAFANYVPSEDKN